MVARKPRNGKYSEYERKILQWLYDNRKKRTKDEGFLPWVLYKNLKIPRSSYYDVIYNMERIGLIKSVHDRYSESYTSIKISKKGINIVKK